MTPERFVTKRQPADLKGRAAAQSHFNDLCELLGEEKPIDADRKGEWYCSSAAPPRFPAARAGRMCGEKLY
jgi:hypothetical protein